MSDGHDKPFCTKAITIIDSFKQAFGDTDKSQFFKAISVIDELSLINFFDIVAINFHCVSQILFAIFFFFSVTSQK